MTTANRYCPNCDRQLTIVYTMRAGHVATCQGCNVTWEGFVLVSRLPTSPIGDEKRGKLFDDYVDRTRAARGDDV